MFDMSWGEVMVIGAVALIVIGPKDLPKALRTVGNVTSKVRRMASEFQSQFNDAMREAELDEIRKQVEGVKQTVSGFNPIQTVRDELKGAVEAPLVSPPAGAMAPEVDTGSPPLPPAALPAASEFAVDPFAAGPMEPGISPLAEAVASTLPDTAPSPASEPAPAVPAHERPHEGRA
jgi:sec-independent protein translocase protein TatB